MGCEFIACLDEEHCLKIAYQPLFPSYKKWSHFQNRSHEEKEGSKYCSTTLKSNKNALLFHIIFSPTVSKCITIISKSIHFSDIENLCSYFGDADDEGEHVNVTDPRTNAIGLWKWQKH